MPRITPAIKAIWLFDGNLLDSSGNGFELVNSGSPFGYAEGQHGKCITRDRLIRCSCSNISLTSVFCGDFTIGRWVRHTDVAAGKTSDFAAVNASNQPVVGLRLVLNGIDEIANQCMIYNAASQSVVHSVAGIGNQWVHQCLTRRASDNRLSLYLNGVLDVQWNPELSPLPNNDPANNGNSKVIWKVWDSNGSTSLPQVDETFVSDRELTPGQVTHVASRSFNDWEYILGGA